EVLGDLLGDRRRAFETAALNDVGDVLDRGAHDARRINTRMRIEVAVFGGGERLDHTLGHEGDRYEDAAFARVFAKDIAVARVHAGGDRRCVVLQRFDAGQALHQDNDTDENRDADRSRAAAEAEAAPDQITPPAF